MLNALQQFYDKRLWLVGFGLLITHLVAALVQHSLWAGLPMLAIAGLTVYLSFKRLEWGLAIAFLEIFIGGHGHLLAVELAGFSLSIRMLLFASVMGVWAIQLARKQLWLQFIAQRDLPFAAIGLAIVIASVIGFAYNDKLAAFDDMNGYLTLLYLLPLISIQWTSEARRLLLQVLAVGALWVGFSTLVYLYAFTHLPGLASHELYTFVRDARLAEVTLLTGGRFIDLLGNAPWYFRIFQQSQLITLAFELVLVAATLALWQRPDVKLPRGLWLTHTVLIATTLASLSRSFWLGGVAALLLIFVGLLVARPRFKPFVVSHVYLGLCSLLAVITLLVLVAIPLPGRPDLSDSSFYKGKNEDTRVVAVSSRWNLLGPMLSEIRSHLILGSGFGETVTFISDDPRLRAVTPSGEVTTYRFEWGYLDTWLKLGILGLFGFIWFLLGILALAAHLMWRRDPQAWLALGLAAALVMLYVSHVFSPYLNHPIGLALMLFILPFFPWSVAKSEVAELEIAALPTMALLKSKANIAFKK